MSKNKKYRRPNKLPQLRRLPKVGELHFRQDLDGEIFPVIILEIITHVINRKGTKSSLVKEVSILQGSTITQCLVSDLRTYNG